MNRSHIIAASVAVVLAVTAIGIVHRTWSASDIGPLPLSDQKGDEQMTQAQPTQHRVTMNRTRLQSFVEAKNTIRQFPLRVPTMIPGDFRLEAIAYESGQPIAFELIKIVYRTPDGRYIRISHGNGVPYDNDIKTVSNLDSSLHGTVTVQGQPAIWVKGYVIRTGKDQFGFQSGPLSLRWKADPGPNESWYVYEIESDALTLDQLVAIANSVQLYR